MLGIAMALLRKRIVDGAKAQGREFATYRSQEGMDTPEREQLCCPLQAISGSFFADSAINRAARLLGISVLEASAIEHGFEGWDFAHAHELARLHPFHYALGRSLRPDAKEST